VRRTAAAFAAFALAAQAGAAEVNLRGGQWLVGMMVEVPGGRGPNPGKLEQEMCLAPSDAQKLLVPAGSPCRISGLRQSREEVTWKIECSQGSMRTSGTGRLEFLGERFKGEIETRADPPYEMRVIQHLAGKRVGECKFPPKPAQPLAPYGTAKDR